jgi:hypothetical protein
MSEIALHGSDVVRIRLRPLLSWDAEAWREHVRELAKTRASLLSQAIEAIEDR